MGASLLAVAKSIYYEFDSYFLCFAFCCRAVKAQEGENFR